MNSWRSWGSKNDFECPPLCSGHIQRKEYFIICSSGKSADFPELPFHGWQRVSDDGRGKLSSQKQKSGHSGGQAECPVFVFFASAVVPNTAGAAPEAAEQTVLPLPVEKRKEWRNGAERLQTLLFSGATRLELANHVARTGYHRRLVLSILNLQIFSQSCRAAGASAFFLHSAQRIAFPLEENPLVFYCFLKRFLLL